MARLLRLPTLVGMTLLLPAPAFCDNNGPWTPEQSKTANRSPGTPSSPHGFYPPVDGSADVPKAAAPKPVEQWNEADWKAFGAAVANEPEVQKMPPLERATHIAERVGKKYDEGGIVPNVSYWGRVKSRIFHGDQGKGSCGDLAISLQSAYEGSGFSTGSAITEKTGLGWWNPMNVNRDHGAPIVLVDGKQYVMDLWLHGGDTRGWIDSGKFEGFKESGFALPVEDWVKVMEESGYKVEMIVEPVPPKPEPKGDAEEGKNAVATTGTDASKEASRQVGREASRSTSRPVRIKPGGCTCP